MTPLESRKQLLVAESELNRAQLGLDWSIITTEARTFTNRAKSFGKIASSAASLVAGLAAFRRDKRTQATKPFGLRAMLKGADLILTLWRALRAPGRGQPDK